LGQSSISILRKRQGKEEGRKKKEKRDKQGKREETYLGREREIVMNVEL
jgi:hypothetical protein